MRRRVEEQRAILAHAARFVQPGGRLAYITCSLLYDENEPQIAHFLASHGDFRICEVPRLWHAAMGPDAPAPRFTRYGLVLSPRISATDGFYVAVMEKGA